MDRPTVEPPEAIIAFPNRWQAHRREYSHLKDTLWMQCCVGQGAGDLCIHMHMCTYFWIGMWCISNMSVEGSPACDCHDILFDGGRFWNLIENCQTSFSR